MTSAAEPRVETEPPQRAFDPFTEEVLRDPYPYYHWLLRHDPVHRGARGIWYVSRYADVQMVMGDRRLGMEGARAHRKELVGPGPLQIHADMIFLRDPPVHTHLRRLLQGEFAPSVMRGIEPLVGRIVNELLDERVGAGEMDVVDFAASVTVKVICELMGIPVELGPQIRTWSDDLDKTVNPVVSPEAIARGHAAMGAMADCMRDLVAEVRRAPREGLLSTIVQAADSHGAITENDLIALAVIVAEAGHDTSAHLIGNGLLALSRHPDEMALLRADPSLIENAIEEILRYDSPVQQNLRVVREELRVGGTQLSPGDMVIPLLGAANRDPERFPDPDHFDIRRPDLRPMSFGYGMRFCVGAPLARLEGRIALLALAQRLRNIRVTITDTQLEYVPSSLFRGLRALPIAFEAQ